MAFEKARVALASLEEKLRRQLGLAGEIGTTFQPNLTAVLIAGDLREPGNAFFKGRHFASCFLTGGGLPSAAYSWQPQADVLIDQVIVSPSAAAATADFYLESGLAAASALVGTWTERKTGTDQVPILGSTGAIPTPVTDANRIFRGVFPAGTVTVVPIAMMIPSGSTFAFASGAALCFVTIKGRIWP